MRLQKLPAAFSGPARGILERVADRRDAGDVTNVAMFGYYIGNARYYFPPPLK